MHSPCCSEVMTLNNVVLWIKQLLNQQTEMLRNKSSSFYLSKRCSVLSCISFIVLNRWKVDCLYIVKRYTTKCCVVVLYNCCCWVETSSRECDDIRRQSPGSSFHFPQFFMFVQTAFELPTITENIMNSCYQVTFLSISKLIYFQEKNSPANDASLYLVCLVCNSAT